MGKDTLLFVIDAFQGGVFDAPPGGPPRLVQWLQRMDANTSVDYAPPLILCAPADAARARGALLVTDDVDGVVMAIDPPGRAAGRARLAAAYVARHHPDVIPVYPGGEQLDMRTPSPPDDLARIDFSTGDRKGVIHPDADQWQNWLEKAETRT